MAKKKTKKLTFGKILLFIILIVVFALIVYFGKPLVDEYLNNLPDETVENKDDKENANIVSTGEISFHFLELGNGYTGDSVYIKAGENDILIDAGSRGNSADDIAGYIDQYVTDGKLEYVIATHADQDHIAAFVGTSSIPGIFDRYEVGIIIDFPRTDKSTQVYKNYVAKRQIEVESGAKHYTALECYKEENGAKKKYELSESINMEILYNYFYENKSSDENNYSVCLLFNHGSKYFLFTGDLEEKGEEYLVEYNDLPEVELFKAGHHGSPTSSNDCLLSVIKPKIVCVCCCAGSDEYTDNNLNMFPAQDFISRVSKYTDKVYVTTIVSDNASGFDSFNGNIVVSSTSETVNVVCTKSDIILKESEWFKENRVWE